jgi:ASC-1-like (ASCH) protein
MKKIEFNVQEPYLSFIKSGQKTIEGRLNKGKFGSLEVGDILVLSSGSNLQFEVIGKREYKTFQEMIISEGIERVIPDKTSIEDAVDVYYRFYTPKQEQEFGVLAVEIKQK